MKTQPETSPALRRTEYRPRCLFLLCRGSLAAAAPRQRALESRYLPVSQRVGWRLSRRAFWAAGWLRQGLAAPYRAKRQLRAGQRGTGQVPPARRLSPAAQLLQRYSAVRTACSFRLCACDYLLGRSIDSAGGYSADVDSVGAARFKTQGRPGLWAFRLSAPEPQRLTAPHSVSQQALGQGRSSPRYFVPAGQQLRRLHRAAPPLPPLPFGCALPSPKPSSARAPSRIP